MVRLSPVTITTRMPCSFSASRRTASRPLWDPRWPGSQRAAIDANKDRRRAVAPQLTGSLLECADADPLLRHEGGTSDNDEMPVDGTERALAGRRIEIFYRRYCKTPAAAAATMATASGCSLARSTPAANRNTLASV